MQDLNLNRLRDLLKDSPYHVQFTRPTDAWPHNLEYHTAHLSSPNKDYLAHTHVCQMILAYMKEHGYTPINEVLDYLQASRRITRYYTVAVVIFENGDTITSEVNGSAQSTAQYYYQNKFNPTSDDEAPLLRVRSVSFQIH